MYLIDLILIAIGVSMDAFAVSICKGLAQSKIKKRHFLLIGIYFGGFQALMPFLGYILGLQFSVIITSFDHWVAFFFLCFIGFNMVRESRKKEEITSDSFKIKDMIPLSIATSIDALIIGLTFASLKVSIIPAITIVGFITAIISMIGLKIGNVFGNKFKSKAEVFGGLLLIFMGFEILLDHLFFH